jgi:hypothetical protein
MRNIRIHFSDDVLAAAGLQQEWKHIWFRPEAATTVVGMLLELWALADVAEPYPSIKLSRLGCFIPVRLSLEVLPDWSSVHVDRADARVPAAGMRQQYLLCSDPPAVVRLMFQHCPNTSRTLKSSSTGVRRHATSWTQCLAGCQRNSVATVRACRTNNNSMAGILVSSLAVAVCDHLARPLSMSNRSLLPLQHLRIVLHLSRPSGSSEGLSRTSSVPQECIPHH